ncbi:MAG: chromosomal replication initiator protein DnaA [Flavobacteriales bacterium]|jgi:chromosomal replication initiator protein|nr:chromosomal replication initiator protein DnaA [Flavobacteriales bacterium]MBT4881258.1 chromosomal replication initiator protein DnaA [Flavobacteriales bacterium]|tara:strand:+ start:2263 stop:3693 length:1431 start_codon:yes stop_codon:yes gene_type:complete
MPEKSYQDVWNNCLTIIRDNVTAQNFKTWFKPIKAIALEDKTLTIQVPSQFFHEWLEDNYITLIKKTIKREIGKDAKLEYNIILENSSDKKPYISKIPSSGQEDVKNNPISMPISMNSASIRNPFIIPGLQKININPQLNESYTFDAYIEGECNRLARSAGFAVSQNPGGTSFNPLFIYGSGGLGKTHLANAIGIEVKNNHPEKTVLYVSADKFQTQFVDAIMDNKKNDFVHFYQSIDVLIIDDVQFLCGKEKTQDVFFHIFNHLHQNKKQVILTSDKAPVDIVGMEQRLLSRFKWGLSADLQSPDLETRLAILKKKIKKDGIDIPYEVVEYIAYSITTNVRELEGALISLLAQSSLNRKEITIDLAKNMLDKFVKNTVHEVSIDYIQKVVCDYFDIPIETMKSKTRKREIVQCRQLAMYFSKQMTKNSLAMIGKHCGNKDHATVLHACKTVNNLADTDKRFKGYISDIEKKLTLS